MASGTSQSRQTRSTTEDPIFGQHLEKLPENKLPIMKDIFRLYLHRREPELRVYERAGKLVKQIDPDTKTELIKSLIVDIKHIWWTRASIPVQEDKQIKEKLTNLVNAATDFPKDIARVKAIGKDQYLINKGFCQLFDVSKCR